MNWRAGRNRAAVGGASFALLLSAFAAFGAVVPAAADDPAVVVLLPPGVGEATPVVDDAVAAQLADLPVRLETQRLVGFPTALPAQVAVAKEAAARLGALTVFWLDTSLGEQLFLYIAEPGGGRVLVRTVEAADETERLESMALIVRSTVEALLAGGHLGIERSAGAATPPASTPPASRRPWFGVRLGYALDVYGFTDVGPAALHGFDAGLLFHVHRNWTLFLAYRFPSEHSINKMTYNSGVDVLNVACSLRRRGASCRDRAPIQSSSPRWSERSSRLWCVN